MNPIAAQLASFSTVKPAAPPRTTRSPQTSALRGADAVDKEATDAAFAEKLKRAKENMGKTAQTMVAQMLVLPLLKQVRDDPFKSEMFHGGFGEDVFGAQLDEQFSQQLANIDRMPLTQTVAKDLFRRIEHNPAAVEQAARMKVNVYG